MNSDLSFNYGDSFFGETIGTELKLIRDHEKARFHDDICNINVDRD